MKSGWLARWTRRWPNRKATKSPYSRAQRVKKPSISRRKSGKLPRNQCPGGVGGLRSAAKVISFLPQKVYLTTLRAETITPAYRKAVMNGRAIKKPRDGHP